VGGWWIQPDCNFPSGFGFEKQYDDLGGAAAAADEVLHRPLITADLTRGMPQK